MSPAVETMLDSLAAQLPALPGKGARAIRAVREEALSRFRALGMPTARHEEWKYTSVAALEKIPFQPSVRRPHDARVVEAVRQAALAGRGHGPRRLVFVDGHYAPELCALPALPVWIELTSLAVALDADPAQVSELLGRPAPWRERSFPALNTAFMQDGALVRIPRGQIVEEPIHLVFVSTAPGQPTVSHPRNLIVAEEGSQATVVETYIGFPGEVYFTNAVTEIVLGKRAVVDHTKVQLESEAAFHIATVQAHQEAESTFVSNSISLGGGLVRNDIATVLDGEGAVCTLDGLYLAGGRQHVDHHTVIDHARPRGQSRQLYKGVLDGQARGVFNGKIVVRPDAQKIDARQVNRNLLLSDRAEVDTKPQLEIFADDVRCAHGASVGRLDEEMLFYLRSRGIGPDEAQSLLSYAFASEVLRGHLNLEVRARLEQLVGARLGVRP